MIVNFRREYGQFITSGAQLLVLFVGVRLESRTGWLACLGLMALISLIAWRSTLKRRRAIADTPTSRIASAAQGYVELSGSGKPLDFPPLVSHLTALPCLWYRYQVEERRSGDKWRIISSGEREVAFLIEDGSGRCVIDVENAEILSTHKERWTTGRFRNTEWKLLINDPIYAIGEFRTLGGSRVELDAKHDLNALLSDWKKDRHDLLRRFDLNKDGELDMQEWAMARQVVRREVSRMHREARNDADVNTLSCPSNGQLYLISNLDPDKIARRYLWWAAFHLTVFFGALGAFPWVLQPSL